MVQLYVSRPVPLPEPDDSHSLLEGAAGTQSCLTFLTRNTDCLEGIQHFPGFQDRSLKGLRYHPLLISASWSHTGSAHLSRANMSTCRVPRPRPVSVEEAEARSGMCGNPV